MKKKYFVLSALLLATSNISNAKNNDIKTKMDLNFRYRIESVDMDSYIKKALASTLRTRATLQTQWQAHWSSVIEFDHVSEIASTHFNSGGGTSPDRNRYPVIADPKGTDLNQAYIRYHTDGLQFSYGRQRILIENQRFIGGVGWRQNEQTFDSFSLLSQFNQQWSFNYRYIFNVNRIFGSSVKGGYHKHDTHLMTMNYTLASGKVSAYYYAIDNKSYSNASNNTWGLRYSGKINHWIYSLEGANQVDSGENIHDYSAHYFLFENAYHKKNYTFGVGYEILGGDTKGKQAFTTSLATLHKFQGWADAFIGQKYALKNAGIKNIYLKAFYTIDSVKIKAFYHTFHTDEWNQSLGKEFDLVVSKKFSSNITGLFKYARFLSDSELTSRNKIWLMLTYHAF
jgi:hypothetical protein